MRQTDPVNPVTGRSAEVHKVQRHAGQQKQPAAVFIGDPLQIPSAADETDEVHRRVIFFAEQIGKDSENTGICSDEKQSLPENNRPAFFKYLAQHVVTEQGSAGSLYECDCKG